MTLNTNNAYGKPALAFLFILAAWIALVYSSLWAAIDLWIGNEIYNHCLIVIPASVYLIYEQRLKLDWSKAKMSWLALFAFMAQLILFVLGDAANVQLFQHIAIFSMLPTLVWVFVGDKLAWQLKFPLVFILFSVPVGEELIPFLQEITADISVYMLKLTGIPLYRSGLFIEIPQGKFLVAEACSGISFLIASIVLGNLYAYMNLVSWKRRLFFVGMSIVFPILANAVRVYGIIYIGYSTNMEHAVGADHLIYGWFFFALVLVCLFLIGEFIRRHESKKLKNLAKELSEPSNSSAMPKLHFGEHGFKPILLTVLLGTLVLSNVQTFRMSNGLTPSKSSLNINLSGFEEEDHYHTVAWIPKFVGNSSEKLYHLKDNDFKFDLYYVTFEGNKGEIASSLNKLYQQERWTLVDRNSVTINNVAVKQEYITTSVGVAKTIIYWYVVDGQIMNSYKSVKIAQLIQKLKGTQASSAIYAVAIDTSPIDPSKEAMLEQTATKMMKVMSN